MKNLNTLPPSNNDGLISRSLIMTLAIAGTLAYKCSDSKTETSETNIAGEYYDTHQPAYWDYGTIDSQSSDFKDPFESVFKPSPTPKDIQREVHKFITGQPRENN